PPAVHAADAVEGVRVRVLAGGQLVAGAQRRFHDAAGGAEDDARAGAVAAWRVEVIFRQAVDVDIQGSEVVDELPRVEDHVHIRAGAGAVHGRQGALGFFGDTWHDGHAEYIFRVLMNLVGKVVLYDRAVHLLR